MLSLRIVADPYLSEWGAALTANEQQIKTAAVRALNKTARWARSYLATQTAKDVKVKVGLVRNGLTVVKAKASKPEIVIGLNPKAGVIKASQLGAARQNKSGVRVSARQFDHAFLARMPSGHQGLFRRRKDTRLPIQEVQIVITGKLQSAMQDLADQGLMAQFERIFERELNYLTRL